MYDIEYPRNLVIDIFSHYLLATTVVLSLLSRDNANGQIDTWQI